MTSKIIQKESLSFLKKLSRNNHREWFAEHKEHYQHAQENLIAFAEALLLEMQKHDVLETKSGKKSLHRIYRDIRFSSDKTPYHTHWGGGFRRAGKLRRGGYYYHIEPGNSFAIGGFWGPNTEDLQRIRQDIDLNHDAWRTLFKEKTFKNTFGALQGEQLSTAPKGYPKDHPAIDLLRYKQFLIKHTFSDEEVLATDFVKKVNDC
ncbi:MAG: DUF2461 domain-containing protein [Cytophagaceae bacterium]|nr:DUF2461 domain-containing protein [Cytophagaceae bacterium]